MKINMKRLNGDNPSLELILTSGKDSSEKCKDHQHFAERTSKIKVALEPYQVDHVVEDQKVHASKGEKEISKTICKPSRYIRSNHSGILIEMAEKIK